MSRSKKPSIARWVVSALAVLTLLIAPAVSVPSAALAAENPAPISTPSEAPTDQPSTAPVDEATTDPTPESTNPDPADAGTSEADPVTDQAPASIPEASVTDPTPEVQTPVESTTPESTPVPTETTEPDPTPTETPAAVPDVTIHISGGCYAYPGGKLSPFSLRVTWNQVAGQINSLFAKTYKVNGDGTLGEQLDFFLVGEQTTGEYVFPFLPDSFVPGNAIVAYLEGGATSVAHITATQCETPEKPTTPEPSVVTTHGNWEGDQPTCDKREVTQTRSTSTVTTTYEVVWNEEAWRWDVVAHEGQPVPGKPESQVLTYQGNCEVVTPTEPTNPTPSVPSEPSAPVDDQGGFEVPTRVETDIVKPVTGTDGLGWLAAIAGVLALAAAVGVTAMVRPVTRRR